jgi:hypothetical protein
MKNKSLFLFIFLFVFSACEKFELKHDICGYWTIFGTGGGIAGQGTPYNFNTMHLQMNNNYTFMRNDTIIERGSYTISKNTNTQFLGVGEFIMDYNSKYKLGRGASILTNDKKVIQEIGEDTIGLYEMYADGFSFYFIRQ